MTERYTLIEGDCLEVMRRFEAASFHAIIVDLPYGLTDCAWDSVIPLAPMWEQFKRVIKPHGAIVLFGSQPFTSMLVMSNLDWFRYEWIWNKCVGSNFQLSNYQPLKIHESILVFSQAPAVFTQNGNSLIYNPQITQTPAKNIRLTKNTGGTKLKQSMMRMRSGICTSVGDDISMPKSIFELSRYKGECNPTTPRLHPTQKPVALLAYLIRTYTNPGETVLDCTMGSGTTGVACMETGRKFVGIEKDSHYFALGAQRIADAARAAQGLPKELRGKTSDLADMPLFAGIGD